MFDDLFVESWRPIPENNGTLKGWLTVRIPKFGIDIRGISFHKNVAGNQWIEMPYRLRKKPVGDLKIYSVRFISADDWKEFKTATLDALNEYKQRML
jgi:hypothetical protein